MHVWRRGILGQGQRGCAAKKIRQAQGLPGGSGEVRPAVPAAGLPRGSRDVRRTRTPSTTTDAQTRATAAPLACERALHVCSESDERCSNAIPMNSIPMNGAPMNRAPTHDRRPARLSPRARKVYAIEGELPRGVYCV